MFNKIKEMFDKHPEEDEVIETIEEIMDEREERGEDVLVDKDEMLLLKNMFKLRDKRACDVVLPRGEICAIPVNAKPEEVKKIILRDKYTRLPVYDKTLDNIIGILHTKDVLYALLKQKPLNILDIMNRHVLFVAPSMRALDLLRTMQAKGSQMAVVVDEFGGCMGLITLEDLLEEVVGEIEDEHDILDEPPQLKRISPKVIESDARIELSRLEKMIGSFVTPDDKEAEIDTLGGLVFHTAGRLPFKGEVITHPSGIKFQIIDVDARRIKKLRLTHPIHRKKKTKKK
ncbi:MAG: HlyC/CorC family transporter [Alphaproteobacteria bacterium]|nr:HlyC/CorC family transporter [Alphaproteobacteria bacterium]